jgi:hypothetical protein
MKQNRTIAKILTVVGLGALALIVLGALTTPSGGGTTSHTTATRGAAAAPTPRATLTPAPIIVDAQTLVQQYDANKLAGDTAEEQTATRLRATGSMPRPAAPYGVPAP